MKRRIKWYGAATALLGVVLVAAILFSNGPLIVRDNTTLSSHSEALSGMSSDALPSSSVDYSSSIALPESAPSNTTPAPPSSDSKQLLASDPASSTGPDISDEDDFDTKVSKIDQWINTQRADIAELESMSHELKHTDDELNRRIQGIDARIDMSAEQFEELYPGFSPE